MKKKEVYEGLTKINRSNVVSIISWGISRDLKVCGSNQRPDNIDAYLISTDSFRDVTSFQRWHTRIKEKVCSEVNGKSLNYYLIERKKENGEKI